MNTEINLLDVVALTEDVSVENLKRGHVGTVVEILAPGVYEVEFSDSDGVTYALVPLRVDQLMLLYFEPETP